MNKINLSFVAAQLPLVIILLVFLGAGSIWLYCSAFLTSALILFNLSLREKQGSLSTQKLKQSVKDIL